MNEEEYKPMEVWAQSQLSRLPEKTAPADIQRLVMLRLQAEAHPSLLRASWFSWPAGLKLVFVSGMLLLGALVYYYCSRIELEVPQPVSHLLELMQSLFGTLGSVLGQVPLVIGNYQIGMAAVSYALILGIASLLIHQAKVLHRNQP
ncbi:MAG: hypothetical protein JWN25_2471 [Verrucomicrobiales bacterium]|nr:hypothetical protein [Verrucomicrobiales bacterium]MDB6131570.1 hypothetical protein [Verrucomicrobiales bacterium]